MKEFEVWVNIISDNDCIKRKTLSIKAKTEREAIKKAKYWARKLLIIEVSNVFISEIK